MFTVGQKVLSARYGIGTIVRECTGGEAGRFVVGFANGFCTVQGPLLLVARPRPTDRREEPVDKRTK